MPKIDLKSIAKFVYRPGDITYGFINERKISFTTALVAFLITNILFFAAPQRSDLYAQMNNFPYSPYAKETVEKKIKKERTNLAKFTIRYDQRSWIISRALLVLEVFLFVLPFNFINFRKGLKFSDHLTASFEVVALATLYLLILMAWINVPILTAIVAFLLFYAFERMAYRWRPFRAMANSALLVVVFYGTMLLYNSLVFFITISTF